MYPKKEVCFTVIAALAVLWHLGSQQAVTRAEGQGIVVSLRDGTHPPPPPPLPPSAELLQADGTHPPPPPWLAGAMQAG